MHRTCCDNPPSAPPRGVWLCDPSANLEKVQPHTATLARHRCKPCNGGQDVEFTITGDSTRSEMASSPDEELRGYQACPGRSRDGAGQEFSPAGTSASGALADLDDGPWSKASLVELASSVAPKEIVSSVEMRGPRHTRRVRAEERAPYPCLGCVGELLPASPANVGAASLPGSHRQPRSATRPTAPSGCLPNSMRAMCRIAETRTPHTICSSRRPPNIGRRRCPGT